MFDLEGLNRILGFFFVAARQEATNHLDGGTISGKKRSLNHPY
jgi:hypothetical protein